MKQKLKYVGGVVAITALTLYGLNKLPSKYRAYFGLAG